MNEIAGNTEETKTPRRSGEVFRFDTFAALWKFDLFLGGPFAELLHTADVDLPHALLRDAEMLADLFERHFFAAREAGSHPDHIPRTWVEVFE